MTRLRGGPHGFKPVVKYVQGPLTRTSSPYTHWPPFLLTSSCVYLLKLPCLFFLSLFRLLSVPCSVTLPLILDLAALAGSQGGLLLFYDFLPCLIFIYFTLEREVLGVKKKKRKKKKRPKVWLRIRAKVKAPSLGQRARVAFLPSLPLGRQAVPPFRPCKSFWNSLQLALLLASFLADHQWFLSTDPGTKVKWQNFAHKAIFLTEFCPRLLNCPTKGEYRRIGGWLGHGRWHDRATIV